MGRHPYERKLIEKGQRVLIESVCGLCGRRIVGSVTEKLQEDEAAHAVECPRQKAASAAS